MAQGSGWNEKPLAEKQRELTAYYAQTKNCFCGLDKLDIGLKQQQFNVLSACRVSDGRCCG